MRSLGSDYRTTQRLGVLETAKAHARLDRALHQLEADPEHEATLSETEIFDLAVQVLIDQERRAASLPVESRVSEAIENICTLSSFEGNSHHRIASNW
ncbi:MAG TPA: hypothetical protein VNY06_06780 [Methylocella sp.]|nr:hypothetical protein [Methylocella sp.]